MLVVVHAYTLNRSNEPYTVAASETRALSRQYGSRTRTSLRTKVYCFYLCNKIMAFIYIYTAILFRTASNFTGLLKNIFGEVLKS